MALTTDYQRRQYGLTGRKRSAAYGRAYSIAGGAPNKPLIGLAADAQWRLDDESTSWPRMVPQCLAFDRGYSRVGNIENAIEWISDDLDAWTAGPGRLAARRAGHGPRDARIVHGARGRSRRIP